MAMFGTQSALHSNMYEFGSVAIFLIVITNLVTCVNAQGNIILKQLHPLDHKNSNKFQDMAADQFLQVILEFTHNLVFYHLDHKILDLFHLRILVLHPFLYHRVQVRMCSNLRHKDALLDFQTNRKVFHKTFRAKVN